MPEEEFTPTHRLRPEPVEAMQLHFNNIEKVADFLASPSFALSNPTGSQLVATYQVPGYPRDFVMPVTSWVIKNEEGRFAVLSTVEMTVMYEAIPKEVKK